MSILRTIRSGSGRARSIDRRPLDRSAPRTSMPSARRNARWNWRAAMPRCRKCLVLSSDLPTPDDELALLQGHLQLVPGETGNRQGDPEALRIVLGAGQTLDIVGRVAVPAGLCDPIERLLDLVEAQQKRMPEGRLTRHVRSPRLEALRLVLSPLMRHSSDPDRAADSNMETASGLSRPRPDARPGPCLW